MPVTRSQFPGFTLVFALAIGIAACGSDSDDGAAESTDSAAAESRITDGPASTDPTLDTAAANGTPSDTPAPETAASDTVGDDPVDTDDEADDEAARGADTLDDPYVGTFGNGGYDVQHYDLELSWDPAQNRLDGVATVTASATQDIDGFNMELVELEVGTVTINGEPAEFEHIDAELAITPESALAEGDSFEAVIAYSGSPSESGFSAGASSAPSGWHTRDGYAYVAGEPLAASTFHPANDHPSDKAAFTYRITAPNELTVAASGTLESSAVDGDVTTWTFEAPAPQATYLTTILIGDFTELDGGTSESGIQIRNVVDDALVDRIGEVFDEQPAMIDTFEELFGPYPFDVYGSAVVQDSFGGALETQTLSIYGADVIGFGAFAERIVAHELAHQWFGNNVSLDEWGDIWLNEGFASYAEALWAEANDPSFSYERWVEELLASGPLLNRHVDDPDELFGIQVYQRGALALHALRQEVGDEVFFEILRTWNERFAGGNATTEDFEDLTAELAGSDMTTFFDAWLRSDELPELPEQVGEPATSVDVEPSG